MLKTRSNKNPTIHAMLFENYFAKIEGVIRNHAWLERKLDIASIKKYLVHPLYPNTLQINAWIYTYCRQPPEPPFRLH